MSKKKLLKFINNFDLYIGAILLLVMLIMLTLQVITRYFFKISFTWTEELSTVMFVWLAYIGASAAVLSGQHLRIDIFLNLLKGNAKKALLILTDLITMGFLLYMIKPLLNIVEKLTKQGTVTLLLRIPKNIIYFVIPFAFLLMMVRFIQEIYKTVVTPENEEIVFAGKTVFSDFDAEEQSLHETEDE